MIEQTDEGDSLTVGMKSLLGAGTAILMALMVAAVALPVERAEAAKMTACVNKKTGTMKMVFGKKAKKKCPKGYKKVTWNSQGPAGPNLSVFDSNDQRVGRFVGVTTVGSELPIFQVVREGGIYNYLGSGTLLPADFLGGGIPFAYTTADCSGEPYLAAGGAPGQWYIDFLGKSLAGMNRLVVRSFDQSGFGVPTAWVGNETSEVTSGGGIPIYGIDSNGTCALGDPGFVGVLFGLDEVSVPKPYDFDGPLEIR